MKLKGLDNIVYPLRLTSSAAAHLFHCYQIQADVAFIDADQDYNAIKRDIQLYYPLVRKEGIFMGLNYSMKGVEQAVNEFMEKKNLLAQMWANDEYFFILKEYETAHFFNKRTKNPYIGA
uniref:Uncharacterized protein n=1 Tax=Acrobeloides nanus TaxID=290746 RepID=A0A914E227_9BILA